MKVLTVLVFVGLAACRSTGPSHVQSFATDKGTAEEIIVAFDRFQAGKDFPTDTPRPEKWKDKKVLFIANANDERRIIVDETAELTAPQAGVDFPTDSPLPAEYVGKKILVINPAAGDAEPRIVVNIEKARAGIDFPTDSPRKDFLVWAFSDKTRIALINIMSIEKAKAGVDYPADGPATLDRNFYVAVLYGPKEPTRVRIP